MPNYQRVTIIRIKKPARKDVNSELQWFGASLGLFNLRDKDRSRYRIFVELLKSTKRGQGRTSDELAYMAGLSRGTVVHHLNKLIDTGIVISQRNQYLLKKEALKSLINDIEEDLNKTIVNIKKIAKDLDKRI